VDHAGTVYESPVDDESATDYETTVDVAATRTRDALVGSALLLAAGAIATALTDDHEISPIAVVGIAAVVAGEQLWHQRRQIPSHVPVTLVDREDDVLSSVIPVGQALFIAALFVGFVLLSEQYPSISAALLGPLAGYFLRDLVMAIRVARWQTRHNHVLAWIRGGDKVESRILL